VALYYLSCRDVFSQRISRRSFSLFRYRIDVPYWSLDGQDVRNWLREGAHFDVAGIHVAVLFLARFRLNRDDGPATAIPLRESDLGSYLPSES
jgi:hypothetical protein